MADETKQELGRRAVACKGWRWMAGMRLADFPHFGWKRVTEEDVLAGVTYRGWLPDLDDPATLGCLLALVRKAWGDVFLFAHPPSRRSPWTVLRCDEGAWGVAAEGATEAEALVAALEAAP